MQLRVLIPVLIATALYGIAPLAEMRYMHGVSVVTVAALFFVLVLLTVPFIYLICRRTLHEEMPTLLDSNRHVLIYGAIGLVLSALAAGLYLHGMKMCNDDDTYAVVAITCAYPVITAVLLWAVYGHTLDIRAWLGLAAIMVGCILISTSARGRK